MFHPNSACVDSSTSEVVLSYGGRRELTTDVSLEQIRRNLTPIIERGNRRPG